MTFSQSFWLTFGILLIAFASIQANPYRGFLIAKDGEQITGFIGGISPEGRMGKILFINDFGNLYIIEANQIRGFVYQNEDRVYVFESIRDEKSWKFLQMIFSGKEARLYKVPASESRSWGYGTGLSFSAQAPSPGKGKFYIQLKDRPVRRITPFRFKKRMKKLLGTRAPELAEKLGSPGYRFKNLESIVRELDEILKKGRFQI
jgi:hypothetical protein